jgi:2-keto-3-deoxy-L-rhamnonate aldolase RhmA
VLFAGPTDLSHALGLDGPDDPAVTAPLRAIVESARSNGKAAGVYAATLERVADYLALGFTLIACSSDAALLAHQAHRVVTGFRELVAADSSGVGATVRSSPDGQRDANPG